MPIRLGGPEPVFPLAHFADEIPSCRKGRKTHTSTVYRMARVPRHGIVLETVKIGRVLFTTWTAINEYHEATNAAEIEAAGKPIGAPVSAPASPRTPAQRRTAIAEAERDLAARGL